MSEKIIMSRDNMSIYPIYIADLVATRELKTIAGRSLDEVFSYFENQKITGAYDAESADEMGQTLFNKLMNDRSFYELVIKNIYDKSKNLELFIAKINSLALAELTNQELSDYYLQYVELMKDLRLWGWVPVFVDGIKTSWLSNYLNEQLSIYLHQKNIDGKFNEYYAVLSSSEKQSEVQQEELARLDMLIKIKELDEAILSKIIAKDLAAIEANQEMSSLINEHLKKFAWLTYAYSGPIMSLDHLLPLMITNLQAGDLLEQKNKILNHHQTLKQQKESIIMTINLPDNLVYGFAVAAEMMFIKDYRKGIYQKSYVAMDFTINKEIAKRTGLSMDELRFLDYKEIGEILTQNQTAKYQEIVKQRLILCCYIIKDGEIEIFQGEAAKKMVDQAKEADRLDAEARGQSYELKGMVAYPGKINGLVKIVLVAKDIDKVNEGDILVSSATNPDLILAMKKAGAFVTDMGGITSHAAIISRELKKPCTVGTRIATQILHDGDEVEVDAEQGIVKIIKRVK